MILVDSTVWIDFFNGADTPQRAALHRLIEEEEDLALTGVILTEVLQGFKRDKDMVKARDLLLAFSFFNPNSRTTILQRRPFIAVVGETVSLSNRPLIASLHRLP